MYSSTSYEVYIHEYRKLIVPMASEKRARIAEKARRTRERSVALGRYDPSTRLTAREKEIERIEKGKKTLRETFLGAPSKNQFLKEAQLVQKRGKKIERAFIFPKGGSVKEADEIALYWYVGDKDVDPSNNMDWLKTTDLVSGTTYLIKAKEVLRDRYQGAEYQRRCTGVGIFRVLKSICTLND